MNLEALIDSVPAYAKDLQLNFSSVVRNPTELSPQQAWGTAVACAMAARNPQLTGAVLEAAAEHLSPETIDAARAAAAIMGMNNVYYRFQHLASNEKYGTLRAGLRMNVIRSHGAPAADFELWCLAVSAINGCGACVDSHERAVREKGGSEEMVLAAVRIAAVLHALAGVFDAEAAARGGQTAAA